MENMECVWVPVHLALKISPEYVMWCVVHGCVNQDISALDYYCFIGIKL